MSTEEPEDKDRGCDLAVKLEQSAEVVSGPFEVIGQIREDSCSRMEGRPMDMYDQESCGFLVESGEAAESGNLKMCHVANSGLSSEALNVSCGETFYSSDVRGALDRETDRSQHEWDSLAGVDGDWGGMAEVMAGEGDLKMVSDEAHCDS